MEFCEKKLILMNKNLILKLARLLSFLWLIFPNKVRKFIFTWKVLRKKVPYSIIPKYFHSFENEDDDVNIKVIYWKLDCKNSYFPK